MKTIGEAEAYRQYTVAGELPAQRPVDAAKANGGEPSRGGCLALRIGAMQQHNGAAREGSDVNRQGPRLPLVIVLHQPDESPEIGASRRGNRKPSPAAHVGGEIARERDDHQVAEQHPGVRCVAAGQ